jgi:hypothetical protein
MSTKIKNKAELLLALIFSDAGSKVKPTPIEGITRLEKLLFLLKMQEGLLHNVPREADFNFIPFRMGPWTNEVYDEVDFLESLGLLDKDSTQKKNDADSAHENELFDGGMIDKYQKDTTISDDETEVFRLTDKGRKKAKEIWERLPDKEKESLIRIKRQFNKMNLRQLLRYVYNKYPDFTTASEIKETLGL